MGSHLIWLVVRSCRLGLEQHSGEASFGGAMVFGAVRHAVEWNLAEISRREAIVAKRAGIGDGFARRACRYRSSR
ncbi:MAG: hypothetical protein RL077_3400 [Verrucomicrobiota bacterium]